MTLDVLFAELVAHRRNTVGFSISLDALRPGIQKGQWFFYWTLFPSSFFLRYQAQSRLRLVCQLRMVANSCLKCCIRKARLLCLLSNACSVFATLLLPHVTWGGQRERPHTW